MPLLRGKIKWAKVLGEPVWGYENTFKEWTFDVEVDKKTIAQLEEQGLGHKVKDKGQGPFVTFSRKELKADGTPNKPIRIVDNKGKPWDQAKKIGNGSVVNVSYALNEYRPGKLTWNVLALQVWEHVPYEGNSEFPIKEDDDNGGDDDWANEAEED